jgi:hypothetical protein
MRATMAQICGMCFFKHQLADRVADLCRLTGRMFFFGEKIFDIFNIFNIFNIFDIFDIFDIYIYKIYIYVCVYLFTI